MALYVLAFTDTAVRRVASDATLQNLEIDGIFAICRRRRAVPPPSAETLRQQHRDVLDIARRAKAVLPVRFGTLIEKGELVKRMRVHQEALRRALDEVRDRVQMTVRVLGTTAPHRTVLASSGRQYLEERRRALEPVLTGEARALVDAVRPLAVRERVEPGAAGLLATVYHLVPSVDADDYAETAVKLSSPNVLVSGPWPPFAFTPQLW